MARIAKPLTAVEVGRLVNPGFHSVGTVAGLALLVQASGARSWILRTMVGGKRTDVGLGAFPEIKLAEAHTRARAVRQQIAEGIDPLAAKRAKRLALAEAITGLSFDQAAGQYITAHRASWKDGGESEAQWRQSLADYASPVLGALPVRGIELPHILAVLEPIWTTKTETATRLRGRIERILDWAKVRGLREGSNPAAWKGNLDSLLARPSKAKRVKNHPAVQVREVGQFMEALRQRRGIAARALEFIALTGVRSAEAREAVWGEFDLEAGVWVVPPGRMKAGQEHRVPLSRQAVELLRGLPRFEGSELVFTATGKGAVSDTATGSLMRALGFKDANGRLAVVHGLRSTFRNWGGEMTAFHADVLETCLAHTRQGVEGTYYRSDLMTKRRQVMQQWADFLDRQESQGAVVPIRREVA